MSKYSTEAKELLERQKKDWDWCVNGYGSLATVITHEFKYDGFSLKVQYNPGRMTSTSAKVDPKSIKERKCFLCEESLPPAQERLEYKNGYRILVNPFPIFPEHFTIPNKEHLPQQISGNFEMLLTLAEDLDGDYTVFYNGPKCGASAPDHFHFQAGTRNFMTVENDFDSLKAKYTVASRSVSGVTVSGIDDGIRKMIFLEGKEPDSVSAEFYKIYENYKAAMHLDEEPLLNIIAWHDGNGFKVVVFLREKHRPRRYFAEGEERILLSPASVDIGGVGVIPVEDDFNRITQEILTELMTEVFVSREILIKVME